MYERFGKRALDVVFGTILVVLSCPAMAIAALALLAKQGRPVLFRQTRPGLRGAPFTMLKFRTMTLGDGSDDERLTGIGRVVRRFSLDELPSLINVVRGDMSLVGPRPLLMQYLPLYDGFQSRRHEVKPGVTGWAQINGRNALSWEDKFRMDVWYVENMSLSVDLRILARTVSMVMKGTGVRQPGHSTTEYFSGNVE